MKYGHFLSFKNQRIWITDHLIVLGDLDHASKFVQGISLFNVFEVFECEPKDLLKVDSLLFKEVNLLVLVDP